MLQLKVQPNLENFLSANIKPDSLEPIIETLCNKARISKKFTYKIYKADSKFNQAMDLNLDRDDFILLEPLKYNTWYPAEQFDGNPEGHLMTEESVGKTYLVSRRNTLLNRTVRFMYLMDN